MLRASRWSSIEDSNAAGMTGCVRWFVFGERVGWVRGRLPSRRAPLGPKDPMGTLPPVPIWVQAHQIWCKIPSLIAPLRRVPTGFSEGESARGEKQE